MLSFLLLRVSSKSIEQPMKSTLKSLLYILRSICALSCSILVFCTSLPAVSQVLFARGINLSGGEFNPERNPAIYGKDYIYPSPDELDYYASKGFAVVRLPFRWERLQPSLFGELDRTELGRIKAFIDA